MKKKEVPEDIQERIKQVKMDTGHDNTERDISNTEMSEDLEVINLDENTRDRG